MRFPLARKLVPPAALRPTPALLCFAPAAPRPAAREAGGGAVSMFGGMPARNMVNLTEKGIPADWAIAKGKERNVKWSAALGTAAYGGPVVAGGRVFVGTNNDR